MVVAVFNFLVFSKISPLQIVYNKEEEELIQESNVLEPSNRGRRASLASISSEMSATTAEISEDSTIDGLDL